MIIRAEQAGDEERIRRVVTAAFGGSAEADLVDALRGSPSWIPALSLVAVDGDAIVGHVLLTRAQVGGRPAPGLDARPALGLDARPVPGSSTLPALGLAPVAVEPSRQRRGVGDALVRAGLDAARAGGEHVVVVIGHPSYYPRFGFVPAVPRGLTSVFAQGQHADAFMVLELTPGALAGVSGPVEYAAPFASFE